MRHFFILLLVIKVFSVQCLFAQEEPSKQVIRGVMLSTPSISQVDEFINFIEKELVPRKVNCLILKVNYHLEYTSRPEIREKKTLSNAGAKRILEVCKNHQIELIPLVNCLGHQSWGADEKNIRALLKTYPEFEENPVAQIKNPDFYCRSYCPLHPEVHAVIFDILKETIDVFEAKKMHVGMDEVFVLGEDACERCKGHNKAELFAGEVNKLHEFLKNNGVDMWMWGDRFLDGNETGLGKWQAAINGTHPAINMISKDIVICDWHYKIAPRTATYFAIKGHPVISCSYQVPHVALQQLKEMNALHSESSE
ncbi:MAG: family 20 glycosylhydrolase [Carboxylicivirga sp.]|nr:family 20 glycosylhydrolase [Carboxylicivirga sp.]